MTRPDWTTVAASVLAAAIISGATAFGVPALRAPAGGDVRGYLLAHPDVIPEAMQALQDRETAKVIAANRSAILQPIGSAWTGNPTGDVTVVEYFDYNCTYCRANLPVIDQLVAADRGVRVVYRELPVLSEESGTAARLSLAAAKLGKFKPFHDTLYAGGPITDQTLAAATRATGIDPTKLKAASEAPGIDDAIRTNLSLMRPLGMTGTPTWVIGDRVLSGLQSLDQLEAAVKDARTAAS